jgi:RimJ/RimL family protein N-acetyltransferase
MNEGSHPPSQAVPDLRRVEEAGLNALQTQRQLFYDGWLVRLSPGKAKRARSVNAFFGSTLPLDAKIDHCARLYDERGLPLLFRITPFDAPADLDEQLARRGYERFEPTHVQVASLRRPPEVPPLPDDITLTYPDADAFVEAVGDLRKSPPMQREAHRERLAHALLPRRGIVVWRAGEPVCVGQVSVSDGYAGLFDVVTAQEARGKGYATCACALLLCWAWDQGAQWAYLQVDATNAPALAVYRKFGYATAYSYHYRGLPGALE